MPVGDLGAQALAHGVQRGLHRGEGLGPVRGDDVAHRGQVRVRRARGGKVEERHVDDRTRTR